MRYEINEETLQDLINIETGLFAPLSGFMSSKDYHSVVHNMRLSNGEVWTIPITLDVSKECFEQLIGVERLILTYNNKDVGEIFVEDFYCVNQDDIMKVYGTDDLNHPGVNQEHKRSIFRVGGKTKLLEQALLKDVLNPQTVKNYFVEKGWKSIVGFQTRNVIHRAHEYLQRIGLEFCDALFINPLVGWKKTGDFSELAITTGYKCMIDIYYKNLNVYFKTLKTPMRYAGPREAIFHAIIRRNLGCTHFIIGRDHAGVGDYYKKYEAHELAKKFTKEELGIELLLLKEPYYCEVCEQIVSENCCGHDDIHRISGTKIRNMLKNGEIPPTIYMRQEVAQEIIKLKERIFIQ